MNSIKKFYMIIEILASLRDASLNTPQKKVTKVHTIFLINNIMMQFLYCLYGYIMFSVKVLISPITS